MWTWDEAKRAANLAKHGIDFPAVEHFYWASALVELDDSEDYGEDRLKATGFIGLSLHVLIFTERGEDTRVISLRKASKQEEKRFAEQA